VRRLVLTAGLILALAGCRDDDDSSPARLMPNTASQSRVKEQCDARDLAYLVGKPRTEIPVPVDPSKRRVSCSTCSVAEDYRPDRTNIVFDAQTGLVISVTCG
jgi:hypothetical protein